MLTSADLAHERIQHVKDVLNDPQALENKYVVPVSNLDGSETKQAMSPIRFALDEPTSIEDIAPTVLRHSPLVGQHSAEILLENGYTQEEVARLLAEQIISVDQY
ncbi:hypothetical protein SDC9_98183 [bioreactor metagenome]|uniref:Uncharacterized protein n=1 Tax=bioreactor metagenome TaxID=1076179 RepID=A0A645APA5_9ZZZZ